MLRDMALRDFPALLIFFLVYVHGVECLYGSACAKTEDCDQIVEECKNGRCECTFYSTLRYFDTTPLCWRNFGEVPIKCQSKCGSTQFCNSHGLCECYEKSKANINGKCLNEIIQKVNEPCYITERTAFVCDFSQFSYCLHRKCTCYSSHIYNASTSSCQSKQDFLSARNMSSYEVGLGNYCYDSSDCSEGLICSRNHECSCPRECSERDGFCHCETSVEIPEAEKEFEYFWESWPLSYFILAYFGAFVLLYLLGIYVWIKIRPKKKRKPTRNIPPVDCNGDLEIPEVRISVASDEKGSSESLPNGMIESKEEDDEDNFKREDTMEFEVHGLPENEDLQGSSSTPTGDSSTSSDSENSSKAQTPDLIRNLP